MTSWKLGAALAAIALAPLATIIVVHGVPHRLGGTKASHMTRSSEGDRREEVLARLTETYVLHGELVTAAMREGAEYAPIGYLNDELADRGAKWRVASLDGLSAETYDVS
jgi:hypothetical protein